MLRRRGFDVNRKAVQRHMREMGLEAVHPGPNLSRRNQEHGVYPYLLRGMVIAIPTRCGARTSPTSGSRGAGCIWWRCWTGTPATW